MKSSINNSTKFLKSSIIIIFSLFIISWGSTGHYKINSNATLSFNQDMEQFLSWTNILADHASDADIRKATDPTEGPKHYIDIDNYSEFISDGSIPQIMEEAIAIHGETFVYDQGILPWATFTTYDSLIACFERSDWDKAVLFASDLGHYVADGHMPLHITRNYNGQFSGNYGIHSRYESTMINAYISQIVYDGLPIEFVQDVDQYVFDYLYHNYTYVDSVIAADNYAQYVSGNTSSTEYKQALWDYSQNFTTVLFQDASHTLAELIFTAWMEAGSPSMTESIQNLSSIEKTGIIDKIAPNPFRSSTEIQYYLDEKSDVLLELKNSSGQTIDILDDGTKVSGYYTIIFWGDEIEAGLYFIVLSTKNYCDVKKVLKLK